MRYLMSITAALALFAAAAQPTHDKIECFHVQDGSVQSNATGTINGYTIIVDDTNGQVIKVPTIGLADYPIRCPK